MGSGRSGWPYRSRFLGSRVRIRVRVRGSLGLEVRVVTGSRRGGVGALEDRRWWVWPAAETRWRGSAAERAEFDNVGDQRRGRQCEQRGVSRFD
jgi:hypothetical protein